MPNLLITISSQYGKLGVNKSAAPEGYSLFEKFFKLCGIFTGEFSCRICYFINLLSLNDASPRARPRGYF